VRLAYGAVLKILQKCHGTHEPRQDDTFTYHQTWRYSLKLLGDKICGGDDMGTDEPAPAVLAPAIVKPGNRRQEIGA